MITCVYISNLSRSGLPAEPPAEGRVQPVIHQLLRPDHSRPDPKHHHVQARQAAQRSVRPPAGKENGTASFFNVHFMFYITKNKDVQSFYNILLVLLSSGGVRG